MTTWNERLAEVLAEKNMPLSHLAAQVGVSEAAVAGWAASANARPVVDLRASHLLRACRILGVCPEWVIFSEMPKYLSERWPFSTTREALTGMPAPELYRIDRFIAETLLIWETTYKMKNHDEST